MSTVETTLIDGSTVRRSFEKMNIGSVESGPITKNVMMNSSNERANARAVAPARMGQIWGSVTLRNTFHGDAPRSDAASSSAGSSRSSAAIATSMKYGKDEDEVRDRDRGQRELNVESGEVHEQRDARQRARGA